MNQVSARVVSNAEVTPGAYLLWLEAPEIAAAAQPGQFVMVRCANTLLRRPLSIHLVDSLTASKQIALLYAVVGKGTQWLAAVTEGDKVDLLGPLGNSFSILPDSSHLLLVSGGCGVAPLAFLAQKALAQGNKVTLLQGAATAAKLHPEQLLPPRAKVVAATDDGSAGQKGTVIDLLPDYLGKADQVFACGPTAMYQALLRQHQTRLKGRSIQVSLEVRMGCGIGACLGCTIKTKTGLKHVCQDGPVFELSDVILEEVKV